MRTVTGFFLVAAAVLAACSGGGRSGSGAATPKAGVVEVTAFEWGFEPETITIPLAESVRFAFSNDGEALHNLEIDDLDADGIESDGSGLFVEASPGEGSTLVFTPNESGEFEFYCTISGHRGRGMVGTLIVR